MIGEEVIAVYGDAGDGEELFEVQKMVRCRECKHWQPHEQYGYDEDNDEYHDYCGLLVPEDDYYAIERRADDFCSYGERNADSNTFNALDALDDNSSEKPNNCELQTIRCPKCGRTDYIRDMEKDMGIKGSHYKYKCINCNTYIKDEPQTERSSE